MNKEEFLQSLPDSISLTEALSDVALIFTKVSFIYRKKSQGDLEKYICFHKELKWGVYKHEDQYFLVNIRHPKKFLGIESKATLQKVTEVLTDANDDSYLEKASIKGNNVFTKTSDSEKLFLQTITEYDSKQEAFKAEELVKQIKAKRKAEEEERRVERKEEEKSSAAGIQQMKDSAKELGMSIEPPGEERKAANAAEVEVVAQNIKEQQEQQEQQGQQGQQEEIDKQQGQEVRLTKRTQHATHKAAAVELKEHQQEYKSYTLRDGTTYTGEMKDGKRHGWGTQTMIMDLGRGNEDYTYTGEWKDGMPHEGTMEYPNGNTYTGEFFQAVRHGQGTLTLPDGVTYTGEWKNGNQHGQVTWVHPDGYTYTGDWKDGKPHIQGTMAFPNGSTYTGEYTEGVQHGQGTYTIPNGSTYTGKFVDGSMHGQGTMVHSDGSSNTGEFVHGSMHGQGTKTDPDGNTTYTGGYKDGSWHGQGTLMLDDGAAKYIGEFRDGSLHGQGTLTTADGTTYTGELRDGNFNGQGTMVIPGGWTSVGEWKDGKLHGQVTKTHADGTTYTGEYKDGKRHGQGTESNNPDRGRATYTGVWKEGKKPSHWPKTNPDGAILTGESKDGVPQDPGEGQTADTSTVITEAAPKDENAPVTAKLTEEVTVTLSGNHKTFKTESGDYRLERYKDGKIKAFKDDQVCSNTKNVLRAINKEYKLEFTSGDFKKMHTRKLGKEIIEKMKMV